MTLQDLILQFGSNSYIYRDAGNGSGYPENGQALYYDDEEEVLADIEMYALNQPHISDDGFECEYASEWIVTGDGDNPYRYQILI